MNQYKIFERAGGGIEAVKQGWSWPAFFFMYFWSLVKKMWLLAGVALGVSAAAALTLGDGAALINLTIGLLFGTFGNDLREKNLARRGFEHVGNVEAGSPKNAIELHLKGKK